jgi:hypothetical protein
MGSRKEILASTITGEKQGTGWTLGLQVSQHLFQPHLQFSCGRYLVPHPERPITTAIAAIIFGSVAPIVVAALEPGPRTVSMTKKMTFVSGIAYGVAFALGYGLLGAIVGAVA